MTAAHHAVLQCKSLLPYYRRIRQTVEIIITRVELRRKNALVCGYHFVVTGKVRVCYCLFGSTEHINYFLNSRSTCAAEITTDVASGAGQRSYANTKAVRRVVSTECRVDSRRRWNSVSADERVDASRSLWALDCHYKRPPTQHSLPHPSRRTVRRWIAGHLAHTTSRCPPPFRSRRPQPHRHPDDRRRRSSHRSQGWRRRWSWSWWRWFCYCTILPQDVRSVTELAGSVWSMNRCLCWTPASARAAAVHTRNQHVCDSAYTFISAEQNAPATTTHHNANASLSLPQCSQQRI